MQPPTTKGSVLKRAIAAWKKKQGTANRRQTTLLTLIAKPAPDNRPDLKLIDGTLDLYWYAGTVGGCIKLLKRILPYWIKHQLVYKRETEIITARIRDQLVDLRAACGGKIPPIPSDLLGIKDWIIDVEKLLKSDPTLNAPVTPPKKAGRIPLKEAKLAYELYGVLGNQTRVAEQMNKELKRNDYTQSKVSRRIAEYKEWLGAAGLPDVNKKPNRDVATIDPAKLGLGQRTDGRATGDQRNKRQ